MTPAGRPPTPKGKVIPMADQPETDEQEESPEVPPLRDTVIVHHGIWRAWSWQ
jgi:hypothetical protein